MQNDKRMKKEKQNKKKNIKMKQNIEFKSMVQCVVVCLGSYFFILNVFVKKKRNDEEYMNERQKQQTNMSKLEENLKNPTKKNH